MIDLAAAITRLYQRDPTIRMTLAGLAYGYPDCCVEWFVCEYLPWELDLSRSLGAWVVRYRDRASAATNGRGYVPCPVCLDEMEAGR
jgi:hypothetical protein